jgi:hypothetical protein
MAIEKQSYLNEVLVRFRRDGTIAGAHQIFNDVVVDTQSGVVLSERAGHAAALDPAAVSGVLGNTFTSAASQIAGLEVRVAELAQERDALLAGVVESRRGAVQVISDRQFYHGLALRKFCTPAEALDAVRTGVLPKGLRDFVETISEPQERWAAEMLLAGAKEFRRDHPFVPVIAGWAGLDEDALDAFWAQCSDL